MGSGVFPISVAQPALGAFCLQSYNWPNNEDPTAPYDLNYAAVALKCGTKSAARNNLNNNSHIKIRVFGDFQMLPMKNRL